MARFDSLRQKELFIPYKRFLGSMIPNCLDEYEGLHSTDKRVWAKLAQHAGREGHCFPSQETLAKELGLKKLAILRSLKRLEEKKFIIKQSPIGFKRRAHFTNHYFFIYHPIFKDLSGMLQDTSKHSLSGMLQDTPYISNKNKLNISSKDKSLEDNELRSSRSSFIREPLNLNEERKSPNGETFRKNLNQKNKQLSLRDASSDTADIFKFWISSKFGVKHNPLSLSTEKVLYQIENYFLKKFDKEEIIEAMKLLDKMAKASELYKLPLKRISLYTFFNGDKYTNTPRIFQKIMEEGDKAFKKDTQYSDLADKIKRYYQKRVLGESDAKFSGRQENDFIEAAKQLTQYMKRKRLEKFIEGCSDSTYVQTLFKALSNKYGLQFTTGNLKSFYTYNDILPKYISEQFEVKTT